MNPAIILEFFNVENTDDKISVHSNKYEESFVLSN
jgi:hypothetical protein